MKESSILSVLVFLVGVCQGTSPVVCSSDKTACEAHEENTLETYFGVPSLEECRLLCQNNDQCQFLTYFYEESQTAKQICFLFSSCEATGDCESCVSEARDCRTQLRCEAHYAGVLQDNIIEDIPDVVSVTDCREFCNSTTGCRFYTYYESPGSVFSKMCFLLSHLIEPYEYSEGVLTGGVYCDESVSALCTMKIEGQSHQSYMFTDTGSLTKVQLMGNENCQMRILAVGGGGWGYPYAWGGRGGGSGYITIQDQYINLGVSYLAVSVGTHGESSRVTFNGEVIVEALPGGSIANNQMNDGYSGGGYWISGDAVRGGYDGSNGEGGGGGQGTGEDVRNYSFENFLLTPGAGGYREGGGGGGGVLVNGGGPPRDHQGQGEGYGGGGEGSIDRYIDGLPGLVIIEIGPQ